FDEFGLINPNIKFAALASHLWYMEIRQPMQGGGDSPLIGVHDGTAYYLLYNGILGDKRPQGGNVLTGPVLESLPRHDGPKVIYGEATRFGERRLSNEGIVFKQIPYDIKAV
ncbi:MAG: site-specific DNA-methyltransferase, partial [Thermodesulfobacteriota bacterium]|nr:site-specific DNA-methyltransferase [Thermodesulfobacteriota bacterium]